MKQISSIFNSVKHRLNIYRCEKLDFRTNRKIVVIESDDWGSIRMPKREGWDSLLRLGYSVDKRPYERYDTLESYEDVEELFNLLRKFRDKNGNHPVITANMLVANPDFDRIKQSVYGEYFFENVNNTYTRYWGDAQILELMRDGIKDGVFMPQFHGREHFNISQWIKELQSGNNDVLIAFNHGICGIAPKAFPQQGNQLMKALLATTDDEQNMIDKIVKEGLQMFESLWGFKSRTFVAPCYLWAKQTEKVLSENGVQLIQTVRSNKASYQSPLRYFYSGQNNEYCQIYSVRNCTFEPSTLEHTRDIDNLILQVDNVLSQKKIVVISSHRINYVSGISKENQERTLKLLDLFLTKLLKKHPDVEFMSTDKLLDIFDR